MYLIERTILVIEISICFLFILRIPKNKRKEASFIFLFAQLPAWILGLVVAEWDLIEYPVRLFPKANHTSITFEYVTLPVMCILFNFYYPEGKSITKKLAYYVTTMGAFTLAEFLVQKYTQLLKYQGWHWYDTFISMMVFIYLVRVTYKWFYRIKKPLSL